MHSITRNRSLATLAVVTGLLVSAAPAVAAPSHAVSDGTSNTVMGFSWSETQTGTAAWDHSGAWTPTTIR